MELPATRHSLVAAVTSRDGHVRRGGFETLVTVYWRPVYKYLRVHWRASADDAQDATQEFFARALEKDFFERFDPSKARFRTFLRVCVDRFIANEHKAGARKKRGGGVPLLPLTFTDAEGELRQRDVAVPPDLDEYFHREWIRSLLSLAVDGLRDELQRDGKAIYFRVFERYDLDDPPSTGRPTYTALAAELGIATTDVTNYLSAARKTFRRILFDQLRPVCGDRVEFEAEARQLLRGGLR